jgi:hypothetical protein
MDAAELAREVNRRIYDVSAGFGDDVPVDFLCECGCFGLKPLLVRDYAAAGPVYLLGHETRVAGQKGSTSARRR